ncbi:STE3-like pheromone receptor [Collybia nuda]|uniref:STE3-like pheromone receptor n=1 Tax=Collybia nuda TaxID=64659 RepID=A0A9P5YFP9_9AGAR|nr:STE3-like pheromone receptor [Collybia nuda]
MLKAFHGRAGFLTLPFLVYLSIHFGGVGPPVFIVMTYPNLLFTVLSFIGFLVCSVPLAAQMKAGNIGACLSMTWSGLACLNQFINSIIWNDSVNNYAPVWCDISSRFIVGAAVAIPACSFCINQRLYRIVSLQMQGSSTKEKRLQIFADFLIGLGLPGLVIILQYVSQNGRYGIYQEIGCYPLTKNDALGNALVWAPVIIIGCFSSVYTVLNLRTFFVARPRIVQFLGGDRRPTLYFRLVIMTCVYGFCFVPLGVLSLYFHCAFSSTEVVGEWKANHAIISHVGREQWRNDPGLEASLEFGRWVVVAYAFASSALFGLSEEVRTWYHLHFPFLATSFRFSWMERMGFRIVMSPSHDPEMTLSV